jgi:uncharacterized integral membrane protein
MKIPLSILLFIAAVLALMFAIPNRDAVTLHLLLVTGEIAVPLYLVVFAALFLGFLFGWIGCWFSQHKWRRRARVQAKRIEKLEEELGELAGAEPAKPAEITKIPQIPLGGGGPPV